MQRERFIKLVGEVLDSLPERFRAHIHNVAVLVEDAPFESSQHNTPRVPRQRPRTLVLGVFQGVPLTSKSVFDVRAGPDYIILYQKNIEAVCANDGEIRVQIRQTVLHELGHYFGMSEAQLEDV